jgi:hypothetical protein
MANDYPTHKYEDYTSDLIALILDSECDKHITFLDLETEQNQRVVDFLEAFLKEAKCVLEAQKKEDESEDDE